jgi:eukaryotic-like serine/threonine-protein kinase
MTPSRQWGTDVGATTVSTLPRDTVIGGDFRIEQRLGHGGMGCVYAARQISTGRMRAVKVLHERLQFEADARSRFEREAWVSAEADGEHLVEVIAAGIDGTTDLPWIAMELLEGSDLAEIVQAGGPLQPARGIDVLAQVCHGLGALHDVGVVHRDVKPSNIFVVMRSGAAGSWHVKLLDLGIAKLAVSVGDITQPVGSPAWMAPEQLDPRGLVSARTDVWALGLVGFWIFTGKVFWLTAKTPEASVQTLLGELLGAPIPPASERAAELGGRAPPAWFDGWFARCVARDPAHRFHSAQAAAEALGGKRGVASQASDSVGIREPLRHPGGAPLAGGPGVVVGTRSAPSDLGANETQLSPGNSKTIRMGSSALSPPTASAPPARGQRRRGGVARTGLAALGTIGVVLGTYAVYDHLAAGPASPETESAATVLEACGGVGAACCAEATCEARLTCRDGRCTGCVARIFSGPHAAMTCAVRTDGATYCWGANDNPSLISVDAPKAVVTPHRVAALVDPTEMTMTHSLAMAVTNGKLIGWGRSRSSELFGRAGGLDEIPDDGGRVLPIEGVERISLSERASVCTVAKGGVWCWGANLLGQVGKPPSIAEGVPQNVELPEGHGPPRDVQQSDVGMACALLQDGSWSCWGNSAPWQRAVSFVSDTGGRIRSDASFSTPDRRVGADQIALAVGGGCIRSGGRVKCFGNDDYCQVGLREKPDEVAISTPLVAPVSVSIVDRKLPAGLEQAGVTDIRAGGSHFCVIDGGGRVWCWGRSHRGQAGVPGGHTSMACEPTLIPLEGKTTALALGFSHTCALSEHGQVFCFGADDRGQLGRGKTGEHDPAPAVALIPCD